MLSLFKCLKGLRLRCPHCGVGALTKYFLGSIEVCPNCKYTYLGQTGDFWGGVLLTYVFAGGAGITAAAVLIAYDMTSVTATTFISVGILLAAILLMFPFCKAVWIHLVYQGRGHYEEYRPPR